MNKMPESRRCIISDPFVHGCFITLIPNAMQVVSPLVNRVEKIAWKFF
jgi:hypothetical protein